MVSKYSVASEHGTKDSTLRGNNAKQVMTSNFKSRTDRDEQNRGANIQRTENGDKGTVSVARGLFEQMADGISRAMSRSSNVSTIESMDAT
mmetsp:Transcript_9975/g.12496  ORF Transcript_9975/g.12496 Transcript_9975/m.12496 type:complete len:91 (+) Transcript_9975:1655-1927(+)